jgi:hypothetical protein
MRYPKYEKGRPTFKGGYSHVAATLRQQGLQPDLRADHPAFQAASARSFSACFCSFDFLGRVTGPARPDLRRLGPVTRPKKSKEQKQAEKDLAEAAWNAGLDDDLYHVELTRRPAFKVGSKRSDLTELILPITTLQSALSHSACSQP